MDNSATKREGNKTKFSMCRSEGTAEEFIMAKLPKQTKTHCKRHRKEIELTGNTKIGRCKIIKDK